MKNVQKFAGLVLISTVLFSTNALAGGSKSGGDPSMNQTPVSAPVTTSSSWLQLLGL